MNGLARGEPTVPASPSATALVTSDAGDAGSLETNGAPLLEIEEPLPEMIAAVAGQTTAARREQLQLQVAQLAGHLRERLREVDRREATLNARVAQLESDLRASRLWISERELAFQSAEAELRRQIEELEEQAGAQRPAGEAGLSAVSVEDRIAELSEREQQLRFREDELRERRFEVDRQAVALRHAQQVWQQQREREEGQLALERQRLVQDLASEHEAAQREMDTMQRESHERIEHREQQLRAAELLVSEHAQQLDRDRAELLADRQAWEAQRSQQRLASDDLRTAVEAELCDRRARLEARQEWIERQRAGLDQVRDEALQLHRQALEMRLIAEQLWAQITGSMAPAEVTQAIAKLRVKLSEEYRLEEQQLAARRDELLELSERITRQYQDLTTLRSGLRDWAAARQAEIEQQAAALVQREMTIDAEQEKYRQSERQWQADRRRYEQQIRDLTSQLRTLPAAAGSFA